MIISTCHREVFMKPHAKRPGKRVQKQMLKKFWLPSRWVKSRRMSDLNPEILRKEV